MHKQFIQIGIVVLAVVFGIFYTVTNKDKNMNYSLLPYSEFKTKFDQTPNAMLIDVRTKEEFDSGHIENAVNIDFQDPSFISEIQKLDKDRQYFVYCRSGNRSAQAVSLMKKQGIKNISELEGGISNI
jgi:rhodanese-related sulfurtransferase